jgi:hypothetical protein
MIFAHMRTSVRPWLAAAAVLSASAWCKAEEPAKVFPECTRVPTESDTSAAKGAFEAGQVSFQEADYARAILYWEDAFRRDCTALPLLLNLARAYELSGDKRNAVVALRTFLARRPNASDKDQIARRIEVLEAQLEREKAAATPAATAAANSGAGEKPAPAEPAAQPTTAAPVPAEPVEESEGSSLEPLWPLFVAGGGLAVGVVGAVLWADGQSAVNKCTEIGDSTFECPNDQAKQDAESGQSRKTAGQIATGVGVGLLIGGGVTWLLLRDSETESAIVAPSIAPGFAGVELAGHF